jgi:ATP-binding cassette subfamily C (CFTR/MRP) protein 4
VGNQQYSLQVLYDSIYAEREMDQFYNHDELRNGEVLFKNFNGYWSLKNFETPSLKNLNFKIEKGKLYGIVGKVGSGKSGLLSAILEEIPYYSGLLKMQGSKAYVEQEPYIVSGTVRHNILFGR